MFRSHRSNVLMLNLTAFSYFCLVILVGLYLYSGSVTPKTAGASSQVTTRIWISWSVVAGLPLITGVLWIMRMMLPRK